MITNQNEINKLEQKTKIYIPEEYVNENYIYTWNNGIINIKTNDNCRTQYNTTYCDCRNYIAEKNIVGNVYECSRNTSNNDIPITMISTDVNDSNYLVGYYYTEKMLGLGIICLGLLFAKMLIKERSYL